jgi:membrane protease YdiL (CAAX protease family)
MGRSPGWRERLRESRAQRIALNRVLWKQFVRQPWRAGAAPSLGGGAVLLKILGFGWAVFSASMLGVVLGIVAGHWEPTGDLLVLTRHSFSANPSGRAVSLSALCLALSLCALAVNFIMESRASWRLPLGPGAGAALPVRWEALFLCELWHKYPIGLALAVLTLFAGGPGFSRPIWVALFVGVVLTYGPGMLGKVAVLTANRLFSPASSARAIRWGGGLLAYAALIATIAAVAKPYPRLGRAFAWSPFRPFADAVAEGSFNTRAIVAGLVLLMGATGATVLYALLAGSATDPLGDSLSGQLARPVPLTDPRQLHRLFVRREGKMKLSAILVPAVLVVEALKQWTHAAGGLVGGFLGGPLTMVNSLAEKGAAGDRQALPFLGSIPISFEGYLLSRSRLLRTGILAALLAMAVAWILPPNAGSLRSLFPLGSLLAFGFLVMTDMAVSVFSLTGDAGASRRFWTTLLFMSVWTLGVSGVAAAGIQSANGRSLPPIYQWSGMVPLLAVAALAIPFRRAAAETLRAWGDPPPVPPIVRTFFLFSAFLVLTGLVGLVAIAAGPHWVHSVQSLFVTAPGLLILLSLLDAPWKQFVWRSDHPYWPVIAPVAGALLGLAAWALVQAAQLGGPWDDIAEWGPSAQVALLLAMGVGAPIVEELFFRAYLIPVIAKELPPSRADWAIGFSALAFAAVHPPTAIPGVLLLGLLNGYLYTRGAGLISTILAHSAFNLAILGGYYFSG